MKPFNRPFLVSWLPGFLLKFFISLLTNLRSLAQAPHIVHSISSTISFKIASPLGCNGPTALPGMNHKPFSLALQ